MTEILVALGILSYQPEGNYEIIDYRLVMNPGHNRLSYFTKTEYVKDYLIAKYGESAGQFEIRKISKSIPSYKFFKK